MRRPRNPARRGAPASPARVAARLIPPLPALLPPRRVAGRAGRLRGAEVGAPRLRGVRRFGSVSPRERGGAEEGETRAAERPFQERRGAGGAGSSRCAPDGAARGTLRERQRERGGHRPARRGAAGASGRPRGRGLAGVWRGWTGRECRCGALTVAVGLVFCRRPRPRLPWDRATKRTLPASVV